MSIPGATKSVIETFRKLGMSKITFVKKRQ